MLSAYAVSKLHNVLFTYELARKVAGTGFIANCLSRGLSYDPSIARRSWDATERKAEHSL